jgi:hypothetical protein
VENVRLEQWKARIFVRVEQAVDLRNDSTARIGHRGLLGDAMITIQQGAGVGPPLPEHAELRTAQSDDSAELTRHMATVVADVEAVTKTLRLAVAKEGVAGLRPMLHDDAKHGEPPATPASDANPDAGSPGIDGGGKRPAGLYIPPASEWFKNDDVPARAPARDAFGRRN